MKENSVWQGLVRLTPMGKFERVAFHSAFPPLRAGVAGRLKLPDCRCRLASCLLV